MPRFGISFTPNNLEEFKQACSTADAIGFEQIGIVDSQSVYRELYVACTLAAGATRRSKFGPGDKRAYVPSGGDCKRHCITQ